MEPPDRLSVATCIGCGAMTKFGTCETGCSEHKLELISAGAYDTLLTAASAVRARADAFADITQQLARREPAPDQYEDAYTATQRAARTALKRHPSADHQAIDWAVEADPATTWWCAECGGLDAPQPCLGICVWRRVEWVNRSVYQRLRERVISDLERERQLRRIIDRVAWITPRPGHWESGWRLLQTEAREALGP